MSEQEQTLDLRVLLKVLLEHIVPILIVTVLAAGIGFSCASFIVPKKYTSSALMYVENSSSKSENSTINATDLTAAQRIVATCQILFTSDTFLKNLSASLDGRFSPSELKNAITISSVGNTEVLRISVETKNPDDSFSIAEKMLTATSEEFHRILKGGSIEVVSEPSAPANSYPSVSRFTLIAALIGLAGSYIVFLILELVNIKVKPDDDLALIYNIPVFAEILDFETAGKNGYKYYKYKKYSNYSSYESEGSKKENKIYEEDGDIDDDDEKVENG